MNRNKQRKKIGGLLVAGIVSVMAVGCHNEKAGLESMETGEEVESISLSAAFDEEKEEKETEKETEESMEESAANDREADRIQTESTANDQEAALVEAEEVNNRDAQIPDELNAYLAEVLSKSMEEQAEILAAMVSDRELTSDEVEELAEKNSAIEKELTAIDTYKGTGIWLEVDADNDGIEDIFLCEFLGGSLGNVSYCLFKGNGEGEYEFTDVQEELKEEFGFIRWEGKNYLLKTTWEFTKKCVNGLSVERYENGTYQGGVWNAITAKEDARDIQTSYLENEEYQSLADMLEEYAKQYQYSFHSLYGTAESECEGDYKRSSDLDND